MLTGGSWSGGIRLSGLGVPSWWCRIMIRLRRRTRWWGCMTKGMQPTMVRREVDEGDPFVDVLFKLRVNEKELLDEWVAQTTLTRSGFVTELLVLELE